MWPLRLMESDTAKILPQLITVTPGLVHLAECRFP